MGRSIVYQTERPDGWSPGNGDGHCNEHGVWWFGSNRCHCSGIITSKIVELVPLAGTGGAGLTSNVNSSPLKSAPNSSSVHTQMLRNFVGTDSTIIKRSSFFNPPRSVFSMMLSDGQWPQIRLRIIVPYFNNMVNLVSFRDAAVKDPVFIGLDIFPNTDSPTQHDVPMAPNLSTRFIRRDLLSTSQRSDSSSSIPDFPTSVTPATLASALNINPAVNTNNDRHASIVLEVSKVCGLVFTSPSAFDAHQTAEGCHSPEEKGLHLYPTGLWGSQPMTDDEVLQMFS